MRLALLTSLVTFVALVSANAQSPLTPEQQLADLTDRLRNPIRRRQWARRHPIRAWHTKA